MKKIVTILTIIFFMFGIFSIYTRVNATDDEINWTDFSKAKYEIEYGLWGNSHINISGVNSDTNSSYYWFITSNTTKPEFNESNISNYKTVLSTNGLEIYDVDEYLELNQDVYLWIVERKTVNDEKKNNFVVESKKIERTGYYKDYRLFSNCILTNSVDQIILENIAWGKHTRNINFKIGKITDNNLLNKLKDNVNGSFDDLLKYSKSAKAIYNNKITSTADTKGISGNSLIQISQTDLDNGEYYFVYVELDDESGKYYPVEGVTVGQVNIDAGIWEMKPYGNESFTWKNVKSSNENTSTPTNTNSNPKTEDKAETKTDSTVSTKILPYTGSNIIIITMLATVIVLAVIFIKKYRELKEIK